MTASDAIPQKQNKTRTPIDILMFYMLMVFIAGI